MAREELTSRVNTMKFTKGQEFIAEFFGTMVLILFGCGSVAMVVLFGSAPPIPGEVVKGGYTNIVLGWGLAVTFGIYVAGTISGAHLNPAVTIALAATKRFPWSKAPHYIVAQFAGAFAAAFFAFSPPITPSGYRWILSSITRPASSRHFRRCRASGRDFSTRSSARLSW